MLMVLFSKENRSGVGVVIQNREGLVLASQSQQLHHAYSLGEIEALAAHRGLQFATELGFENVVLEGVS